MASKISRYDIVVAHGEVNLIQEVNQHIVKGWHPLGGPVVFIRPDGTQAILQAMVKSPSH